MDFIYVPIVKQMVEVKENTALIRNYKKCCIVVIPIIKMENFKQLLGEDSSIKYSETLQADDYVGFNIKIEPVHLGTIIGRIL